MKEIQRLPKRMRLALLLAGVLFTLLGLWGARAQPTWLALPLLGEETAVVAATGSVDEANCRYGAAAIQQPHVPWLDTLGLGWYVSFQSAPFPEKPQNGAEFVHILRVRDDKNPVESLAQHSILPALTDNELGAMIDANPGGLWLVGNEPDVSEVQDDTRPAVYARAYEDAYHYIKQRDPSAQVGIGGLSMMTPGRIQYLDLVWDGYIEQFGQPMTIDVWNFHLYILSEIRPWDGKNSDGRIAIGTDPALAKKAPFNADPAFCPRDDVYCRAEHDDLSIFESQIVALRTWMKAHGQQNKPLILSEYSQLYPFVDFDDPINPTMCFLQDELGGCFTEERVNAFMNATFDYLETAVDPNLGYPADDFRLVQQWLWFSLIVDPEHSGGSSNLLKQNYADFAPGSLGALTGVGLNMDNQLAAQPHIVNLRASKAQPTIVSTDPISQTAEAVLTVDFHNNGNRQIDEPFTVTFFKDAALTQPIGSQLIAPAVAGCARRTYHASTIWTGLEPGLHQYWVQVNSDQVIAEGMTDNLQQGVVLVDATPIYLPLVARP